MLTLSLLTNGSEEQVKEGRKEKGGGVFVEKEGEMKREKRTINLPTTDHLLHHEYMVILSQDTRYFRSLIFSLLVG